MSAVNDDSAREGEESDVAETAESPASGEAHSSNAAHPTGETQAEANKLNEPPG
jgi:hypothetical protein